MTDQELKDLVAWLAISQAETSKQLEQTDKRLEKKRNESEKRWEKLEKQYWYFWDFIQNDGKVVEEYFYTWLNKTKKIHWEKYDDIYHNEIHKWREFDIIWYNWNKITTIEIKKIVHLNDVKKLLEIQMPELKEWMKDSVKYRKHKIYWWVAWFKINKDAEEYAKEHWVIVLTKHWNQIEELTKDCEIKSLV